MSTPNSIRRSASSSSNSSANLKAVTAAVALCLIYLLVSYFSGTSYGPHPSAVSSKMSAHRRSAVVVIAMKGFQDHEFAGVMGGLAKHGFHVDVCGKEKHKEAVGKFGSKQLTACAMSEIDVDKYDRIAFVGGPGAGALRDEPDALNLARKFFAADKVVGAICIAPTILAHAGVLKGKKATVWDSKGGSGPEAQYINDHGAHFVPHKPVVVDGKVVTGNGPDAAEEFGETFASM